MVSIDDNFGRPAVILLDKMNVFNLRGLDEIRFESNFCQYVISVCVDVVLTMTIYRTTLHTSRETFFFT